MTAGVTSTGFVLKTIEDLKDEIEADQLATIDAGLNLNADQPIGQLNAIYSKKLAELWEVAQIAYNGFNRDAAEGRLLDNVGALTGTPRDPAKKSRVSCTVNLNAGFSQPAGAMFAHVAGQDAQWTNAAAVGPIGTTGNYTIEFNSVDYGPIPANAGTLTAITNTITGWNSITNPLDAELGSLQQDDTGYRQNQEDELTAAGGCTVDSTRAALLEVKDIIQAFVYENETLVTDGTGLPGKAIECVVYDGAVPTALDNAIAQAIWDNKPSGAETFGSSSGTAVDKYGKQRTVNFSRATVKNVYLEFDVSIDPTKFPSAGDTLIKDDAVAKGNALTIADAVVALVVRASALAVPGVKDVVALRLGFSASPVGTVNLAIAGREIARFDTSRVVVNHV